MALQCADASTLLRETTKVGAVIGLVTSASSTFFNFNPKIALVCTAVCGVSWILSRACAQRLELIAQDVIKHLKDLRDNPIIEGIY